MPDATVHIAASEVDFEAVRTHCKAWIDWQLRTFPEKRDTILTVFEPASYARTLDDLPRIHARPKGAILLARLDDRPVGCVMYHETDIGVAEVKRLFVDESGRGHGLGRRLINDMFKHMRNDGYAAVRFSSAKFLTHARHIYESVGFIDIPQPSDLPETLKDAVYFMERAL